MDLTALLKQHTNKHKSKPVQFSSVAGGVQKRLEKNIESRKSTRLTVYDTLRNLSITKSPIQLSEAQIKSEQRLQQLQKWKEDRDKKKKEALKNKKNPFKAGVPHYSLKFELPPPPPSKMLPSSSGYTGGRVTRSQSAKNNAVKKSNEAKSIKTPAETSFAPKNATFKAPQIKNLVKLPVLAPVLKPKQDKKTNLSMIAFDPVIPNKSHNASSNILKHDTDKQSKGAVPRQTPSNMNVNTRSRRNQTLNTKSEVTASKPARKPVQSSTTHSDMESKSGSSTEKSPVFTSKVTPRRSYDRTSRNVTPKNPVPKSESNSEEKLRSPTIANEVLMTPEQIVEESKNISPCVTLSRGKDNARKEMKKKMDEGLLDEDTSGTESVEHFRRQLNAEITRLTAMCEQWDKISEQTVLPEPVLELVLAAVGQARLLMSSKFQQFASLLEKCAAPDPSSPLVTPADLRGFWDVVFLQVENVEMRFKNLEGLRSRNWVEEQVLVAVKNPKPQLKKAVKPSGSSRMREIIAAARRAKQPDPPSSAADASNKTFDGGFFSVESPLRAPPALQTPLKSTHKAVLSTNTKASPNKCAASLAIMRASNIGKCVDDMQPSTPSHLNPINLFATPARSILKPSCVASTQKSGKKSVKVVLFDDYEINQDNSFTNTKVNESPLIKGVELLNINTDSGMSSMKKESELKENIVSTRRTSNLIRQNATDDRSPVLTRSRRKSMNTPLIELTIDNLEEKTARRSGRKKVLEELVGNVTDTPTEVVTPKRSSRR